MESPRSLPRLVMVPPRLESELETEPWTNTAADLRRGRAGG